MTEPIPEAGFQFWDPRIGMPEEEIPGAGSEEQECQKRKFQERDPKFRIPGAGSQAQGSQRRKFQEQDPRSRILGLESQV